VALDISADPANSGPERHNATVPDVVEMLIGGGGSLLPTSLSDFPVTWHIYREKCLLQARPTCDASEFSSETATEFKL